VFEVEPPVGAVIDTVKDNEVEIYVGETPGD
jgi:hypothetical protein